MAEIRNLNRNCDEDMNDLRIEIRDIIKEIHILTMTAIAGIAGIVVSILGFICWSISFMNSHQNYQPAPPAHTQEAKISNGVDND